MNTTPGILLLIGLLVQAVEAAPKTYRIDYTADFRPDKGLAHVTIRWGNGAHRIRRMELKTHERMSAFDSNLGITRDGAYLILESLEEGATLSYDVAIDSLRDSGEFDARITPGWAVWRGDDLVPAGRIRQQKDTEAEAYLTLRGPEGWTFKTPYRQLKDGRFYIQNPERSYDRPTGWMVGGEIGVRLETIAGIKVGVAGPVGQDIRRMDILAFLNWTLPTLAELFPQTPNRLLVVVARDRMWRGGLSAGNSLYLHADRPLISGNGTSTVLHEMVHVASGLDSVPGADWIVEGLAEYYSLKLLLRSGSITQRRFERALDSLREWSADAGPLDDTHSKGPTTAKAALIMRGLDLEIERRTRARSSLDDVFRQLVADREPVSLERLRTAQGKITGSPSQVLAF